MVVPYTHVHKKGVVWMIGVLKCNAFFPFSSLFSAFSDSLVTSAFGLLGLSTFFFGIYLDLLSTLMSSSAIIAWLLTSLFVTLIVVTTLWFRLRHTPPVTT